MARRHDFDTPWKEALALYLPSFFEFFFPDLGAEIDWSRGFRFLDKELRKIAPSSATGKREADTLVEVYQKNGTVSWALVHIEVQSQVDSNFLERMFLYYVRILDRYAKPVTSLAVLGDDSPNWRPEVFRRIFWGTELSFKFPTAKLLDWQERLPELERSSNPFSLLVAATLHVHQSNPGEPVRREAKFRLVRQLYETGLDKRRIRELFRLVDWVMSLSPEQAEIFEKDLEHFEEEKNMPYITSIERRALERERSEGREEGRLEALRRAVEKCLCARFGEPAEPLREQLRALDDPERLEGLIEVAARASDYSAFTESLNQE